MFTSFKQTIGLILFVVSATSSAQTFRENFSEGLSLERWTVSTWTAPRHGPTHSASFKSENVGIVNGVLRLKLSQSIQNGVVTSVGGEIMSKQKFGFGTYTFVMKASADENGVPWSGSITGIGLYLPKSKTEIDIEVEGIMPRSKLTQVSTWENEEKSETIKIDLGSPHEDFHTYVVRWTDESVKFYRDGTLISDHRSVVPTAPANLFFNHWGTNSLKWGGLAIARDRYMFVKSVTFVPLILKHSD